MTGLPIPALDSVNVDEIIDAEIAAEELIAADPSYTPTRPRFVVDGIGKADWAMQILNGAAKQRDGVLEQAEAWRSETCERLNRIAEWERAQLTEPERTIAFMSAHLERYAVTERERTNGKTKTIGLPSGKITTRRAEAPKVNIADPDVLLKWCAAHLTESEREQVVKVTESVLISEFRKFVSVVQLTGPYPDDGSATWAVVTSDGVRVDGVAIEHPHTEATVVPG